MSTCNKIFLRLRFQYCSSLKCVDYKLQSHTDSKGMGSFLRCLHDLQGFCVTRSFSISFLKRRVHAQPNSSPAIAQSECLGRLPPHGSIICSVQFRPISGWNLPGTYSTYIHGYIYLIILILCHASISPSESCDIYVYFNSRE